MLPQKQMEKVPDRWKKAVTMTFYSQPAAWDTQCQYETSELLRFKPYLSILIIEKDY